MPASPSALKVLIDNVVADLGNTGVHPDVGAFTGGSGVAVFLPLYRATPYFEVTPGGVVGEGEEAERAIQDLSVWIVHAIVTDALHEATLLGLVSIEGMATLERVVRQSLERPEPYVFAPFNTSPYVKQDGTTSAGKIVAAWSLGSDPPEIAPFPAEEEPSETSFFVRQRVAMRYLIEEDG